MGDIWNKIDEEMSKPRLSGYDVMGPVGAGIQGAKALTKAMGKKKKQNEYYSPDLGKPMRTAKMADKAPKINLRKEYKD
jgi:hypothetical protein